MAGPVSSPPAAFGQEFEDMTTLLVRTSALEAPERRVWDGAPTAVHLTDPIAPRGKVAYPAATSVRSTATGISQELRSVALQGDTLIISLPPCLKQRPPLSSLFDSLREFVEKEKRQEITRLAKQKAKLLPAKRHQDKEPQRIPQQGCKHQQHTSAQYSRQQHISQCPAPCPSTQAQTNFLKWVNRPFPFKREFIPKIFKSLLNRADFRLPEPIRPDEVGMTSHPKYCLYHRRLGHVLEDCVIFKVWLEKGFKEGTVAIPDKYLVDPPLGFTKVIFDLTDGMSDYSDD